MWTISRYQNFWTLRLSPVITLGMSSKFFLAPACAYWTFFSTLDTSLQKRHAPSSTEQGLNTTPVRLAREWPFLTASHSKMWRSWGRSLTSLQILLKTITEEQPFRKLPQKFSINQTTLRHSSKQLQLKGSTQAINLSWWKHNLKNSCLNQVHIKIKK